VHIAVLIELDCIVGLHVFQDLVQHIVIDSISTMLEGRSDLRSRRLLCGRLAQYRDDLVLCQLTSSSARSTLTELIIHSLKLSINPRPL
jgi:hypothetical protein